VLAVIATLVALAAAEVLLRVLPLTIGRRLRDRHQAQIGDREPHPRGLYRIDPAIGWTLAPGFAGRFRGPDFDVAVEANADGLRDPATASKAPGTIRLLGLGDSFAFGWGVENEQSLFKVLERRLRGPEGRPVEVVNAGIPGFGTFEELALLRSIGLRYQPDLVMVAFYEGNDYQNNAEAPRKRTVEDGYLRDATRESGATRWLLGHSVLAGLVETAISGLAIKRGFAPSVDKTKGLLAAMKSVLEANGIPLVLVFIPDQDPEAYRRPALLRAYDRLATGTSPAQAREQIRALCGARGIAFCELSSRFEGEQTAGLRLEDTHFSPRGHELAAEEVLACLRTLDLPVLRSSGPG